MMNKKYNILGVPMNKQDAQILKFTVTNQEQQGAHFTKDDIKELLHSLHHPSKELQRDSKEFDKLMKEER